MEVKESGCSFFDKPGVGQSKTIEGAIDRQAPGDQRGRRGPAPGSAALRVVRAAGRALRSERCVAVALV